MKELPPQTDLCLVIFSILAQTGAKPNPLTPTLTLSHTHLQFAPGLGTIAAHVSHLLTLRYENLILGATGTVTSCRINDVC